MSDSSNIGRKSNLFNSKIVVNKDIDDRRSSWVDMAKLMAIIAVIIDHTNGSLYQDTRIAYFSYYSVSLFILVMGVTSYWSYSKYKGSYIKKVGRNCLSILGPYLVAAFIYEILFYGRFVFLDFINRLIHFNNSGPFYYVFLYIQLLLLVPILYSVMAYSGKYKYGFAIEIVCLIVVFFISVWTTKYTNILDIYGGGGNLQVEVT